MKTNNNIILVYLCSSVSNSVPSDKQEKKNSNCFAQTTTEAFNTMFEVLIENFWLRIKLTVLEVRQTPTSFHPN